MKRHQCSSCLEFKASSEFLSPISSKFVNRCRECQGAAGMKVGKKENLTPANLIGAPKGTYTEDKLVPARAGSLDHTKLPSVRAGGRVNQYTNTDTNPRLRSQHAGDNQGDL